VVEALVPAAAPRDRDARTGYLMAVTASALFAVNGVVSKVILLAGMPAQRLTELRSAGACLGLLGYLAWRRPELLRVSRRELPVLAAYGVLGFAFVQWWYFVAIARLPVGIALLLEYTAPLLVALWARFGAHEQVRRRVWAALALALAGLALVAQVWSGSTLDGLGVAAALGAAVSLAFYFVLGEHVVSTRDPLSLTCYAFGFATLFWSLLQPWWTFPASLLGEQVTLLGNLASTTLPLWALAVWMVVLGTIVPFSLIIGSLQHLRATQVGVVGMTEPVLATLVAFGWLAESLSPVQVAGGVLVLVGVVLAETSRAPSAPARNPEDGQDVPPV